MDITSNHLDVVPHDYTDYAADEQQEEFHKRIDTFGHPVGKSALFLGEVCVDLEN